MNEPLVDSLSKNLAYHVQDLRHRRELTQNTLAKLANIPRSTLANIESGTGNPSLVNLARLAAALHVQIEELLAIPHAPCQLIRHQDIKVIQRSQGSAKVYKLLPDPIPGMEIDRIEIEPSARMGGIPHTTGTKEYLHCLEGEITVKLSGDSYCVREGDVLAFPGDCHHSYQNSGTRKAIGLSVVTMAPIGLK